MGSHECDSRVVDKAETSTASKSALNELAFDSSTCKATNADDDNKANQLANTLSTTFDSKLSKDQKFLEIWRQLEQTPTEILKLAQEKIASRQAVGKEISADESANMFNSMLVTNTGDQAWRIGRLLERKADTIEHINRTDASLLLKPGSDVPINQSARVSLPDGRQYDIFIPRHLKTPVRAVFAYHGVSDPKYPEVLAEQTGLHSLAEEQGFVLISPIAAQIRNIPMAQLAWEDHVGEPLIIPEKNTNTDDVSEFIKIRNDVNARIIDIGELVGSVAHSNGVTLVSDIQKANPESIAFILMLNGTFMKDSPAPALGVPVTAVQNSVDGFLPLSGGPGKWSAFAAGGLKKVIEENSKAAADPTFGPILAAYESAHVDGPTVTVKDKVEIPFNGLPLPHTYLQINNPSFKITSSPSDPLHIELDISGMAVGGPHWQREIKHISMTMKQNELGERKLELDLFRPEPTSPNLGSKFIDMFLPKTIHKVIDLPKQDRIAAPAIELLHYWSQAENANSHFDLGKPYSNIVDSQPYRIPEVWAKANQCNGHTKSTTSPLLTVDTYQNCQQPLVIYTVHTDSDSHSPADWANVQTPRFSNPPNTTLDLIGPSLKAMLPYLYKNKSTGNLEPGKTDILVRQQVSDSIG